MVSATPNRARRLISVLPRLWRNARPRRSSRPVVVFFFCYPMNFAVSRDLMRRLASDGRTTLMVAIHADSDQNATDLRSLVSEAFPRVPIVDADDLYVEPIDLLISPVWEPGYHHLPRLRQVQPIRSLLGLGQFRSIQIFHGLADKKGAGVGNVSLAKPFDHLFLLNPIALRHYERLGMSADRLHLVGFCKLDRLARGEVEISHLKRELGAADGPVVLYAPTWEFVNDDPGLLESVIDRLSRCRATVMVKLHDLTANHYRGTGLIEALAGAYGNVRFVQSAESAECLALADLLVSDMSSIAFEFLVRDRPIVFVETASMVERFGREGIEYSKRHCGEIVRSLDDLDVAVQRALDNPWLRSEERAAVLREVLFDPGRAIDRAAGKIYELLDMTERHVVLTD